MKEMLEHFEALVSAMEHVAGELGKAEADDPRLAGLRGPLLKAVRGSREYLKHVEEEQVGCQLFQGVGISLHIDRRAMAELGSLPRVVLRSDNDLDLGTIILDPNESPEKAAREIGHHAARRLNDLHYIEEVTSLTGDEIEKAVKAQNRRKLDALKAQEAGDGQGE